MRKTERKPAKQKQSNKLLQGFQMCAPRAVFLPVCSQGLSSSSKSGFGIWYEQEC